MLEIFGAKLSTHNSLHLRENRNSEIFLQKIILHREEAKLKCIQCILATKTAQN